MAFSMVQVIAHCADRSTNCPSPVFSNLAWAASAPTAASAPAWRHACGTLSRTGARSGSPCSDTGPPIAAIVRSMAMQRARGPSLPKGDMRTCTMAGLIPRTASTSNP